MKRRKPSTFSQRFHDVVDFSVLTTSKPKKSLTVGKNSTAGRNSQGRLTSRHMGGGHKKQYRVMSFGQGKLNIPGKVKSIEYDPNRSCFIALISYKDGDWAYVLAPEGLKINETIICSDSAPLKLGNRLQLKYVPAGQFVHNVEVRPLEGGKLARGAGNYLQVVSQEERYTDVKMPSGEVRKILNNCFASVGQLSNIEHKMMQLGKAGRSRWMGTRPEVRGKVMNAKDHPYGGGEGRNQRGTKRPKTKWGKVTGGHKTRKPKKYSNSLILSRRPSRKKNKK